MNNISTLVRVRIKSGHRECTFPECLDKTASAGNLPIYKAVSVHHDSTLIAKKVPLGRPGAKCSRYSRVPW